MNPTKAFVTTLFVKDNDVSKIDESTFYDIEINMINGDLLDLNSYKGKYVLIVNVASKCGFTSQYESLQKLYEQYKDKLVVIGVPCNQFGRQEPGTSAEIKSFCKLNYGVTFPITEKIDVKGKNQHKLYKWLTNKVNNGSKDSSVKWNFQKYLIDKNGALIDYYFSSTNPLSSKITKHIK
jgi:glutathione peroxidase